MTCRERDCVAIVHKAGSFLRLDFVDGAIVLFSKNGTPHIQVIGDSCLREYFTFRTKLVDDESVTQASRSLTMREGLEVEAILRHCRRHRGFEFPRVARFLRSAFPQYCDLLVK